MKGTYPAVVAIVTAALTAPAALAAAPAQPSSLTGEHLAATFATGAPAVTAQCDPAGVSTISTSFSGTAGGPFPGTFTAALTVKIGPQSGAPGPSGFATGPLLEYREVFRIDSAAGTVYGAKTLLPNAGNVGTCREFRGEQPAGSPFPFVNLNGFLYEVSAPSLLYGAFVSAGRRTTTDQGTAGSVLSDSYATCCPNETGVDLVVNLSSGSFSEDFASAPISLKPGRGCGDPNHSHARKDECDDD
jgi:hypothetical protein